jgi:THO complex subunit 2
LTVREAEHFGRFLKRVLDDLSRWHKDKAMYKREALVGQHGQQQKERTLIGFATEVDADGKPKAFVEHAQFKDLLYGWHRSLNAALKACLGGMEWMQIRNAITVLKSVLDFFPAVDFMAQHFMKQLKTITDREAASKAASGDSEEGHRVDLSVAAQTAMSELQKRKSKWVMVQGFRPNMVGQSFRRLLNYGGIQVANSSHRVENLQRKGNGENPHVHRPTCEPPRQSSSPDARQCEPTISSLGFLGYLVNT